MIKAVIIDDEQHGIVTITKLLEGIGGVEVVATTQDSRLSKELIELHKPDLVFLDIQMPFLNGFDVLEQFEEIDFKVIITTAYDQFAIRALKFNAFDFLLKPIDKSELEETLKRYIEQRDKTSVDQVYRLKQMDTVRLPETIALSTSNGLYFAKLKDILYLEADGCYTTIVLQNGNSHLVSKTMGTFDFILEGSPSFFKAHKSYIVNLNFIEQYIRGEGGELVMINKKVIPLSRNRKQEFLSMFHKI
jgi:two-component system, LytTR family, response regulator